MNQVSKQQVLSLYKNILRQAERWPLTPERHGRDLAERIPDMVRKSFKDGANASGNEASLLYQRGEKNLADLKCILGNGIKQKVRIVARLLYQNVALLIHVLSCPCSMQERKMWGIATLPPKSLESCYLRIIRITSRLGDFSHVFLQSNGLRILSVLPTQSDHFSLPLLHIHVTVLP